MLEGYDMKRDYEKGLEIKSKLTTDVGFWMVTSFIFILTAIFPFSVRSLMVESSDQNHLIKCEDLQVILKDDPLYILMI